MDNMSNRSKQMDKIYQKIALNRGIELYNNGETNDAIKAYEKSLKYPLDNTLTASAYYLKLRHITKMVLIINQSPI